MTVLSVNINKFATLRNARGGNNPNVVQAALDCEHFGAQGITVHPRPDERHIRYQDVLDLKPVLSTEFNIEGYPDERLIELVLAVKPAQVTLVPDSPDVLTSNAGWNCIQQESFLVQVIDQFKAAGIRTSLFIDPVEDQIRAAAQTGTDRIELYTEAYAVGYSSNPEEAIAPYRAASETASDVGLGLNAGHDLDLNNLPYFQSQMVNLLEVSIGHALICDALYLGLEETIKRYRAALDSASL
ncbi:MAG: pyridoxine 5'-phosphate synthase [Flavobacteriales bacterium]|nr:pyridoxine 5'-phosphate synthase [Flavobacteriales bacterium]